jgi:hypothetical protein
MKNILEPYFEEPTCLLACFAVPISSTLKMEPMFLRNVGWNSTDDTASYPRWYSLDGIMADNIYFEILHILFNLPVYATLCYYRLFKKCP